MCAALNIICAALDIMCAALNIMCAALNIICGALNIVCAALNIICGAFYIICCAMNIICGALNIICGGLNVIRIALYICGALNIICGGLNIMCGALNVLSYYTRWCNHFVQCFCFYVVVVSQCVRTAVGLRYVTTVSRYNFAFQCVLKRGSLSIPIKIFSEEHKIQWCTNTIFSINKLFNIVLSFYVLRWKRYSDLYKWERFLTVFERKGAAEHPGHIRSGISSSWSDHDWRSDSSTSTPSSRKSFKESFPTKSGVIFSLMNLSIR